MSHPLGVEIEASITHHRRLERDIAGEGFERVGDALIGLRRTAVGALTETRPRVTGEAVEIKSESKAHISAFFTHQREALLETIIQGRKLFRVTAAAKAGGGYSAQLIQQAVVVAAMGAHGGIIVGQEYFVGALVALAGEMIHLDHHAALHHLADQEFAKGCQACFLAVLSLQRSTAHHLRNVLQEKEQRVGVIIFRVDRRRGVIHVPGPVEVGKGDATAVKSTVERQQFLRAGNEVRVMPRVGKVADIADPPVTVARRKIIVHFVHREQDAYAAGVILIQPGHDIRLGATLEIAPRHKETIEQVGGLDTEHHRQLAGTNLFSCFLGGENDAEPALAGTSRLRIDITLHGIGGLDYAVHRDHVIAGVALGLRADGGQQLADGLLGGGMLHHQPQARQVGPLNPLVILHLVRRTERRRGPLGKCGVAVRVVGIRGQLTGNQCGREIKDRVTAEATTEEILAPTLAVHQRAVGQRMFHAKGMERCTVEQAAASECEIGQYVRVGIDEAEQIAILELREGHRPGRIQAQFGKVGAVLSRQQCNVGRLRPQRRISGEERVAGKMPEIETSVDSRADLPLPLGLQAVGYHHLTIDHIGIGCELQLPREARARADEVAAALIVKQIAAEVGRLQAKTTALPRPGVDQLITVNRLGEHAVIRR